MLKGTTMELKNHKAICEKCRNRKTCKTPCAFAESILRDGNKTPFYEVNDKGLHGEKITMCMSKNHRYEINESGMDQMHTVDIDGEGWSSDDKKTPFTTEADSPWSDFQPKLNQTTVFIKRFFQGMAYADIAQELDVSVESTMSHYQHACNRMMEALKLADMKEATIAKYKLALERSHKATGKLPKYIKWLLMNKVFDLTVGDIAELEGTTSNTVASKIRVAYDKVVTGEYSLLEPTLDDIEAAQMRMQKKRARERKGRR